MQSLWLRLAKEMNAYQGVLCQHIPTVLVFLTTRSEAGRLGGKEIVQETVPNPLDGTFGLGNASGRSRSSGTSKTLEIDSRIVGHIAECRRCMEICRVSRDRANLRAHGLGLQGNRVSISQIPDGRRRGLRIRAPR